MSKSRYSKTKAAGVLCGMSRCKDYGFKQAGVVIGAENTVNRQMRRLCKKVQYERYGADTGGTAAGAGKVLRRCRHEEEGCTGATKGKEGR